MKYNKNGFTLIEVIGVITILSLMLLVAVPALTKTLKRNEQKKYDDYVNNLKLAAENYVVKNIDSFQELNQTGGKKYILITTLLQEEYIKEIQQDPSLTDEEQPQYILVTLNADGTFNYEVTNVETPNDEV